MHRLPEALKPGRPRAALLALAAVLLASPRALAQRPAPRATDAGVSCEPERRALEASQRAVAEAERTAQAAEREGLVCKQERAATSERLEHATATSKACQKEREEICSATSSFADELARGKSHGAIATTCVSAEQQARLDAMVGGWSSTSAWLGQVASYQSGETDTVPRARGGGTPIERMVQHLTRGGGGRLFHRRLLIEALKIVAPRALERLRGSNAAAIDAWFTSTAPLETDLVAEAQHVHAAAADPTGPPLTAALHLVRAFQIVAPCNAGELDAPECGRAHQLQQLLESSGSLVVQRRVQEVWATECTAITPESIAPWLEDFPTPHLAKNVDPWHEVAEAAHAKLFACYLDDSTERAPYGVWLAATLPSARSLTAAKLERVEAIKKQWVDSGAAATCARAVRAMQTMPAPATCAIPSPELDTAVSAWTAIASKPLDDAGAPVQICAEYARLLWEGKAASIDGSFARPPSVDEMVVTAKDAGPTAMARLRAHCEERRGDPRAFADTLSKLASFARGFGEGTDGPPFRIDARSSRPVEAVRYDASRGTGEWLAHVSQGTSACTLIGLTDARCRRCGELASDAAYDCALVGHLQDDWSSRTRRLVGSLLLLGLLLAGAVWARRLQIARAAYAAWARDTGAFFEAIGLAARTDRLRNLFPSRYDSLELALPSDAAWEQWGTKAWVVRTPKGSRVLERDVNHAAFVARRAGASVALLEHDDEASPDLSAIRAMLEWAAKGGTRAVQILPIATSRARWSKSAHDVLDLVEQSSLRGNPFELRGRITTSAQFFNRERLVSGLLASAQAGHWTVVTGLRRFGKSSLALEVARRLPGPAAYVDLAGFDHEIGHDDDPAVAVNAILRYVCLSLVESARSRWPNASMQAAPEQGASLDAATLTLWFRDLSRACREASGRPPPFLVILDEVEQVLAVGPTKLAHALDVLAIVIGRLKSAVGDAAVSEGGSPIGVLLGSAVHPLLWAPLRTLANQSIMGSFQRVCVPCLGEDAATTMMRSLGARQGIRFSDAALARIVEDSQGVPLLLRRIGASVLELYDPERARQGSLGAVEVGIEGATEAIEREAREGSPVRVWVETEIAARSTVAGVLLRRLAREERVSATELRALAKTMIAEDFVRTGIDRTLTAEELERRSEEAAHVTLHLLDETGLLVPHGDLTSPEAYSLPDGAIRRVLRAQASVSAFPIAEPAP
jgi:hypothetical protein